MKNIGIIGSGVSGLHLGINLVNQGVDATIYAAKKPEEIAASRMSNSVSHQFDTVLRERELEIEFWNEDNCRVSRGHHHFINTHQGDALFFWGSFDGYGKAVDYRLYLPKLMQTFEERGGKIIYQEPGIDALEELAHQYDLLAIGTGKGKDGFATLFPKIEHLSVHDKPARLICCGLYKGIRDADPCGVTISISVGHGELIEIPIESPQGPATVLLFENIPGGDMEDLVNLNYADNPRVFHETILEKLKTHHTSTYDRVVKEEFCLTRKLDLLQGSLVPITRESYASIGNNKFAIATGDLRVTMDPVNGQGANLASYGACVLADEIISAAESELDENFCKEYDKKTAYRVEGTVNFNNAILNPQPQLLQLLGAMSENRRIADDFTARFAKPETAWWDILCSAEQTGEYLKSFQL